MYTYLRCVKGDNLKFSVYLTDVYGYAYTLQTGDFLTFKVKENIWDTESLISEDFTQLNIEIDSIDLDEGTYCFEVSLTYANGEVSTFVTAARSRLIIEEKL